MYSEKDVLDTLLQKIYAIVSMPDTITGVKTDRVCLSVCMPGIPLPPESLDFGFTTMSADQIERAADFSKFVDIIPLVGASWSASGRTVSKEYEKVVRAPVLPQPQLTNAEQALYAEAQSLLWTKQKLMNVMSGQMEEVLVPSVWQQRYDEYQRFHATELQKYLNAQAEYIAHMQEPGQAERWSQLKPILESSVRDALKKWEAAGRRKVEEAWGVIGNLDSRGLQASWADRRARFEQYKRGSQQGDFWLTKYFPNKFWESSAGWLQISLKHDEVHTVDEKEQTSWGGGGGASFGLWRVGGDVSYESQKTMASMDSQNIEVRFEMAMVPLLRGWLDGEVFSSRSWKFDPGTVAANEALSDGGTPPKGTMPIYPTALVLARNVVIHFDKKSEVNKSFMETIRGSASVGWGPFSARANYYKHYSKVTHDFVEDEAGLRIDGMQVIGFVSKMLDKCPDPDSTLNW